VLVVVLAVRGVAMTVVDVVDMIRVRDRHVTATLAVGVVVRPVLFVAVRFALVEMTVVLAVDVPVVDVVDVVAVRHPDVSAALAVDVGVFAVLDVARCHGTRLLSRAARRVSSRPAG
jgi:hypothetical protein